MNKRESNVCLIVVPDSNTLLVCVCVHVCLLWPSVFVLILIRFDGGCLTAVRPFLPAYQFHKFFFEVVAVNRHAKCGAVYFPAATNGGY